MSRLTQRFETLRRERRKALASFITAGDPDKAVTVPALHALVRGGADLVELGMPFSDPEAEGPVIQAASERALRAGLRLADLFGLVRAFRSEDAATPVVLMGYLNNVERYGYERFAQAADGAGVDGLIMVNLPPEEAAPLKAALAGTGIELIFLIAPTTAEARRRYILSQAGGWIYYVSLKGVTGAANLEQDAVARQLRGLRSLTELPVLVGFGIKDGATARGVAAAADGVVVGSALVSTMAALGERAEEIPAALEQQLREIRAGMDAATP